MAGCTGAGGPSSSHPQTWAAVAPGVPVLRDVPALGGSRVCRSAPLPLPGALLLPGAACLGMYVVVCCHCSRQSPLPRHMERSPIWCSTNRSAHAAACMLGVLAAVCCARNRLLPAMVQPVLLPSKRGHRTYTGILSQHSPLEGGAGASCIPAPCVMAPRVSLCHAPEQARAVLRTPLSGAVCTSGVGRQAAR
jgi:hypothetical protein